VDGRDPLDQLFLPAWKPHVGQVQALGIPFAVAAVNANTVVVLQTGGPVEMPWLGKVRAVLQIWYPGQELGNAVADV
ncbi:glycoside hydrolase family 3 C-terminal domain-containing protein, partial [Rhizobium leguminosarum]|uniref:glycoside hydrolase family 3 C-terminal domain-containing protein n=1 Tax=Rhizobium leguminosarum TaxID=384 RepID=UPI003F94AB42